MAIFDRDQQKVIVRVVYDGPGKAGKTTNLQQLCKFFTKMRRSELYVPEEMGGRTLFFDWLQVEGGVVGGYGLRCQLLTVPGQQIFNERRKYLLQTADVVVFVCDSTPSELENNQQAIHNLLTIIGSDIPLVVQANKQDLVDSLPANELLNQLGLEETTSIVSACAQEGIGVRETVVLAIRAAATLTQQTILEHGLESIVGISETKDQLYSQMVECDVLYNGFKQPVIEEQTPAQPISLNDEHEIESSVTLATECETPDQLNHEQESAEGCENTAQESDEGCENTAQESEPVEIIDSQSVLPVVETSSFVQASEWSATLLDPTIIRENLENLTPEFHPQFTSYPTVHWPPLPTGEVPSGFIWPASGREILRELATEIPSLRDDLISQRGHLDGSGKSDVFIFQAGQWCLKTSSRRGFKSSDAARSALLHLARAKLSLHHFALGDTVVSIQPDNNQTYWLWTVAPWVVTLRAEMNEACEENDEDALAAALVKYADAIVDSLLLAARRNIALDVHPSNFAIIDGQVVYLDDDIVEGNYLPSIGYAMLHRVEEYAQYDRAIYAYVEALGGLLQSRISGQDVEALDLERAIEQVLVRTDTAKLARRRLAKTISHGQYQGNS
ncbi:MAG: GTPase domain-containing protein [Acidobacteriota bacterium]